MFEILEESAVQKEKFRVAANKLLNHCFLLWKREDTKKEYSRSLNQTSSPFKIISPNKAIIFQSSDIASIFSIQITEKGLYTFQFNNSTI